MIGRPATAELEDRIRKAWAANREDTDFTLAVCAARMGTSIGVVHRVIGPVPRRSREPGSLDAVRQRKRRRRV